MKSNSRKFKNCMFCGSGQDLNREHVFGAAVSKKFPGQKPAKVPRSVRSRLHPSDGPNAKKHYKNMGSKPLSFTSYCLCKKCNEALGGEHTELTQKIVRLFSGQTNRIPSAFRTKFIRYLQRIGIIIDLETAAFDPTTMTEDQKDIEANLRYRKFPPTLSAESRSRFVSGEVLNEITVFIGKHTGNHGKNFAINIAPIVVMEDGKGGTMSVEKRISLCFPRVAVLIYVGNHPQNSNKKLSQLAHTGGDIKLDPKNISNDADVILNYSKHTIHLDGSVSLFPNV